MRGPTPVQRVLYFAYGLNMDEAELRRRCPRAALVSSAWLPEHRFLINGRGVATVSRHQGSVVHGLLWSLSLEDVVRLDRFEGVPLGLYVRQVAEVHTEHGPVEAELYVAADAEPGPPRVGYLERIVAAAREHNLPAAYVDGIEACGKTGA